MLAFSDFLKVFEAYTAYSKTAMQAVQPTVPQAVQPQAVQPTVPQAVQPQAVQPTVPQAVQPTNADIMQALGALKTPFVNAQAPEPESIDDIICRIAGIEIPSGKDGK